MSRVASSPAVAGVLPRGPIELPTRLAGTTSRFVTALAALGHGPFLIDGAPPLRKRPMGPLHDALAALGATIEPSGGWGRLPVTVAGPLEADGSRCVATSAASSFGVDADRAVRARWTRHRHSTGLVSRPYLQITRQVMADFGHETSTVDDRHIQVAARSVLGRRLHHRTRRQLRQLPARRGGHLRRDRGSTRVDERVDAG